MNPQCRILCIGRKDRAFEAEISRYERLLRPYARLTVAYIKPPARGREGDAGALAREALLIRRHIDDMDTAAALAEEGEIFSSEQFARFIDRRVSMGGALTFIIGGAYGLADEVKKTCGARISLSRLTFPHRLCVLLLAEQVYRAFTILKGHPYHK